MPALTTPKQRRCARIPRNERITLVAKCTMSKDVRIGMIIFIALFASLPCGAGASRQASQRSFTLPEVLTATDIPYPTNTTTTGMVALSVSLDGEGKLQNLQVLQDTPPLTAAAEGSVRSWTFRGAHANETGIASNLPLCVVFNPYNPGGTSQGTGALTVPSTWSGKGSDFLPPQVLRAAYALYPPSSVQNGTVVLTATVDAAGHVAKVKVVHGVRPLVDAAVNAVKQWGFQPATRSGQAVAGKVCIAFVFQRNLG